MQRINMLFCFVLYFYICCQFDFILRASCSHILPPALKELHLSSTRKPAWLPHGCARTCVRVGSCRLGEAVIWHVSECVWANQTEGPL